MIYKDQLLFDHVDEYEYINKVETTYRYKENDDNIRLNKVSTNYINESKLLNYMKNEKYNNS